MTSFVALLPGINVGGKNLIAMSELAASFRDAGYANVRTHGQSGNVLFETENAGGSALESSVELEDRFGTPIPVVIPSAHEIAATVAAAPPDHGSDQLRSEVFFLKHPLTAEAVHDELPEVREGVDSGALGSRRALLLPRCSTGDQDPACNELMAVPVFQQMTFRSWWMTNRLLEMLDKH